MAIDKEKQFKRQDAWKKENRERLGLTLPKGTKEKWQAKADAEGISLTEYIVRKMSQD